MLHDIADRVTIFGVTIANITRENVINRLGLLIAEDVNTCHPVYIANAHTLNIAAEDSAYRFLLNQSYLTLSDGAGVRWATRLRSKRIKENLVGTDLIPLLFQETSHRGYSYFLLGSDRSGIERAASYARATFPGWAQAGFSHGYIRGEEEQHVIETINKSGCRLLLVGMGNPLQEKWIDKHRSELTVPVAIGVGGLFDHWAGNLRTYVAAATSEPTGLPEWGK